MASDLGTLSLAAASIGFLHCVGGPDHYLPFVAMSRVGVWSLRKTLLVTTLCGIGHVIGSALFGLIGIAGGLLVHEMHESLEPFVQVEISRGNVAAWLLALAGGGYFVWGLYRGRRHDASHAEPAQGVSTVERMTPWILFTIFAFGPCEPLIPLLMYPAAQISLFNVFLVTAIFGATTLLTMGVIVAIMHRGLRDIRLTWLERYRHAVAGFVLFACGIAMLAGL
jgi:uncharacterized membrane protein YuzA (DUF378 family)